MHPAINRPLWALLSLIIACAVAAPSLRAETRALTLVMDAEEQVVDNFGASDCWSMQMLGAWSLENRNRIADLLFSRTDGIGLSCWRFNLGAGKMPDDILDPWRTVETFEAAEGVYDWNRQAGEQWFLGAAKARGVEQFVAFVNSPPARMTKNGLTRCTAEVGSTNLKTGYEGQFARYLADILHYFATHPDEQRRIAFDWISPVNEPMWDWNEASQEGNRAGNDDIKAIVAALHRELRARNLTTNILAPECGLLAAMWAPYKKMQRQYGQVYGDYLDAFCSDPKTAPLLCQVLCSHSYWYDVAPFAILSARRRLKTKLDQYPGWRYWMTEYCIMQGADGQGGGGRDLTIKTALETARIIHYDMTLCNASAWHWWTAVSPCDFKDGLIYTDYRKPGDPETIYPSKTLWALGHFSRFIRPGARRVTLAGADELQGLLGSAYRSADGKEIVFVFINMAPSETSIQLNFQGLPNAAIPQQFRSYRTSEQDDLREHPLADLRNAYVVPGHSLTTLVGTLAP